MPEANSLKFWVIDNPQASFISNARTTFENPMMITYYQTVRLENPIPSDGLFFSLETHENGDAVLKLCQDTGNTNLFDFLDKPVMAYQLSAHRRANSRVYAERRFNPDSTTRWVLTCNGLVFSGLETWVEESSQDIQYFPNAKSAAARFERIQKES